MVPRIRIITFGPLQIFRDDYAVTERDWHTRQARQLLKILLTERPRPVASDRLIEILWPDSVPAAAATTLRSAVNALRNVLEPDRPNRAPSRYVITRTPGYAFELHPDIWLDVAAFERELAISRDATTIAARIGHIQAALDLYQDDYLSTDRYADWAMAERERLQELYFGALLQRAGLDAQQEDFTAAIAAARSVLARDPVRETAYQALMRFQALAGDSAGALITFERCRNVLADELGADPSPVTNRLHQAILSGEIDLALSTNLAALRLDVGLAPPSQLSTQPSTLPNLPPIIHLPKRDPRGLRAFVGRATELARLHTALQQLYQGEGGQVYVIGETGAGKSRLLHHVLHEVVGDAGPQVDGDSPRINLLSTACHPLVQSLPFAPIADLIGSYLGALSPAALAALPPTTLAEISLIIPQLRDRLPNLPASPSRSLLDAPTKRLRIVESCAAFFAAIATIHPTVLVLDDLHWADSDTLAVLQILHDQHPHQPLLLLAALRSDDMAENPLLRALLHTLERDAPDSLMPLSALARADVHAMLAAAAVVDAPSSSNLATTLHSVTHGNPLFLTEALLDLQETAIAEDGQAGPGDSIDSPDATALALQRNQHVQSVIQERLQRLPTAARTVLQVAATIGRAFDAELLEAATPIEPAAWLDLLLERYFLVARGEDSFDFPHDIVRRVVLADTNPLQRRRNHLAVAVALEALGEAEDVPAELAHHYRQAGARHARSFVHYSILAGQLYLRVLGFIQAVDHFSAALATLEQDPELAPESLRDALEGLGLAYEGLADLDGVSTVYQRLALWADAHGDRPLLLTTHSRLVAVLALLGHQQASRQALHQLHSRLSQTHAKGMQAIHDLVTRRHIIYTPDTPLDYSGWVRFAHPPTPMEQAAYELPKLIPPAQAGLPLLDYGHVLLMQGHVDAATHIFGHLLHLATETHQPLLRGLAQHQLGIAGRMLGDMQQARTLHHQALDLIQSLPLPARDLAAIAPRLALAALALQEDQLDAATTELQAVNETLEQHPRCYNYRHSANILLGLIALQRGDFMQGEARLETAVADPFNLSPATYVRGILGLARLAYWQKQPAISSRYLRRALAFAGRRSLLDEYIAALQTAVHLQPADAPLIDLIDSARAFTIANDLHFPQRTLQDAARRVEAAQAQPVRR